MARELGLDQATDLRLSSRPQGTRGKYETEAGQHGFLLYERLLEGERTLGREMVTEMQLWKRITAHGKMFMKLLARKKSQC